MRILYFRTDAIGDNVLASAIIPQLAARFPDASITIVCQDRISPLYEKCPHLAASIGFDRARAYDHEPYRNQIVARLRDSQPDLAISSVFSREPLSDFLLLSSNARERVAMQGDLTNLDPKIRAQNDPQFTHLITASNNWRMELDLHHDFLKGIRADTPNLSPRVWTDPADVQFAADLFREHNLNPTQTIALFAGAQFEMKKYAHFGTALSSICPQQNLSVIALGSPGEFELNQTNLNAIPNTRCINLSGKTTLRQSAEIIRLCRLALAADSGLAHVACAVQTPNVVLLGGGHFGRFIPYSNLTTAVALPLECYACNWQCRFPVVHCVKHVDPRVIQAAVRHVLANPAKPRPSILLQSPPTWNPPPQGPRWAWFAQLVDRKRVDVSILGSENQPPLSLALPHRHRIDLPNDPAITQLQQTRLNLAKEILSGTIQSQRFQQVALPILLDPKYRDLPASPDELPTIDQIRLGLRTIPATPFQLQCLAAASLYFYPWELSPDQAPFPFDPPSFPPSLSAVFCKWLLASPRFPFTDNDLSNFLHFTQQLTHLITQKIAAPAIDPIWRELALSFLSFANFIPVYFEPGSHLPLYQDRAKILAFALNNLPLHHVFPPREPSPKIRLGFLNAHWNPQTETYATLPAFEHLDRSRFDITLFSHNQTNHPLEQYCRSRADRFIHLVGDFPSQVAAVRNQNLDLLFFGTNLTAVSHHLLVLAMHRLAPIQITSICSPLTTGLPTIDVFIAGTLTESPDPNHERYSENLALLPGSGLCFSYYNHRPPPSNLSLSRQSINLAPNDLMLVSGANFFKIGPALRLAWTQILASVPNSKLVLYPFGPAWSNDYPHLEFSSAMNLLFQQHNVDPNRLILLKPFPSSADVSQLLSLADLYLDSFPYSGATSLLDPLGVSLVPIAMDGAVLRFAQARALLTELNLPELIAATPDHYVRLATDLAINPDKRRQISQKISLAMQNNPPFLDAPAFSSKIAALFEQLYAGSHQLT